MVSIGQGGGRGGGRGGGHMMGGRRGARPPQNTVQLVQKPSKVFQIKLKATLRDLKHRGFELYERCKKETTRIFDEVNIMARKMKIEQEAALKLQNE